MELPRVTWSDLITPYDANAVGVLALVITITAMARSSDRGLLALIALGVAFWAVHYGMLGSQSGAIVHGIAAVGIFCAHLTQEFALKSRVILATVFSTAGVSGSLYFGSALADALAAIGCVLLSFSEHTLRGPARRQGMVAGQGIFFVYALLLGSVPGMTVTTLTVVAGVVGLRRMRI
ncbi:MAG: hypothetical protein EA349_13735 [Halomonadaceae bacterium]|nr:MAG: hypothetical protein EA349_13735 [Halomonadaceae bacterium]